jgi:hypothetical protein
MPARIALLNIMTESQKREILAKHGYTITGQETEAELNHTIREDVDSGEIEVIELEKLIDRSNRGAQN